jgi:putative RNA 2'-phosphotransferase
METKLSKTLSYLLRHNPEDGNLEMDPQGFVALDSLLDALAERGWRELDPESFMDTLDDPSVERFERRGTAVRATYGHSVDVDPEYPEIQPEFPLYHGTSPDAWTSIKSDGLKPMNRQYVHLSRSIEEARRVGHRHANSPIILSVKSPDKSSMTYYRAGPVVLAEHVPSEWLNPMDPDR